MFVETPFIRRKLRAERVAHVIMAGTAFLIVAPLLIIVTYLVVKAAPALSIAFIVEPPRDLQSAGGIWPALVGTVYIVVIALMVAAPIGVLAAVYLQEYAQDNWVTRAFNLAVLNLAGVPSIVHGLFGLGAFVLAARLGQSVLAASLTLAAMTLPVVIASTKEALAAVPRSFREACWNVGASRWQTIRGIVLPNAVSGILTGVILQVSRTAGETAPVLFTGAVMYKAVAKGNLLPYSVTESCMTLATHLYNLATQISGVPESYPYATALVLLAIVLLVNSVSIIVRLRLRSATRW